MFIRKKEDFTCEVCGEKVKGDGYTNHCPKCLWSKHVDDKSPGDRKSTCKALMEPISYEKKADYWVLTHKCTKCGTEKKQKIKKEPIQLLNK